MRNLIGFVLGGFILLGKCDNKVNVTVYIESYCPCSGEWQYNLQEYFINTTLGSLINLYRYWDGTAEADGNVTCFHGPDECLANQLNACAQNMSNTWEKYINYTVCLNGSPCIPKDDLIYCPNQGKIGKQKGIPIEQNCADIYGYNWDELYQCGTDKQGLQLLWESALHGNEANELYGLEGLPVVWVNNTRFSTFWDCNSYQTQMKGLIQRVCNVYKSINPNKILPSDCIV